MLRTSIDNVRGADLIASRNGHDDGRRQQDDRSPPAVLGPLARLHAALDEVTP